MHVRARQASKAELTYLGTPPWYWCPAAGDRVSVWKLILVSPNTGTSESWFISMPEVAKEGPVGPTVSRPAGFSTALHGWGTGVVTVAPGEGEVEWTVRVEENQS